MILVKFLPVFGELDMNSGRSTHIKIACFCDMKLIKKGVSLKNKEVANGAELYKKLIFRNIHRKTTVLESLVKKNCRHKILQL